MTARDGLRHGELRLTGAGVPSPALDAERLLRHVLGRDRAALLADPDRALDAGERWRYERLLDRRCARVPLQHLVGEQSFWRAEFAVRPGVLIPRPETEGVVEASLEKLAEIERPLAVDVGTGSGCIALSLAMERPGLTVHAVDASRAALALARLNARRLGLSQTGRVVFHRGDMLAPLRHLAGRVDLVASNPPYVALERRPTLQPEVRDHDPAPALFPSGEPFAAYRRLLPAARTLLRPGGALVVELGLGMERTLERLAARAGLAVSELRPDLAGLPRVLVAVREETGQ